MQDVQGPGLARRGNTSAARIDMYKAAASRILADDSQAAV